MKRLGLVLACAIALVACGEGDGSQAVAPRDLVRPVKIATVRTAGPENTKTFPGITEASRETLLAFRVEGQIVELPVRAGQRVAKGTLIARLDEAPYRITLADREAKFELARTDFERQKALFSQEHVSEARLDAARSTFKAAQAALDRARDDLAYTRLTAPFDGEIGRIDVDAFQNVLAKQTIAMLQGDRDVDVTFGLPEGLLLQLDRREAGSGKVLVEFDAMPDRLFEATYREHETVPDPVTRSFKVVVSMARPVDLTVLPGMSVTVHADLSKNLGRGGGDLLLPVESVFEDQGKTWVWRLDADDVARRTEVGRLDVVGHDIRLGSGLREGDRVIAAGTSNIREGQKVRPIVKERGL